VSPRSTVLFLVNSRERPRLFVLFFGKREVAGAINHRSEKKGRNDRMDHFIEQDGLIYNLSLIEG